MYHKKKPEEIRIMSDRSAVCDRLLELIQYCNLTNIPANFDKNKQPSCVISKPCSIKSG